MIEGILIEMTCSESNTTAVHWNNPLLRMLVPLTWLPMRMIERASSSSSSMKRKPRYSSSDYPTVTSCDFLHDFIGPIAARRSNEIDSSSTLESSLIDTSPHLSARRMSLV